MQHCFASFDGGVGKYFPRREDLSVVGVWPAMARASGPAVALVADAAFLVASGLVVPWPVQPVGYACQDTFVGQGQCTLMASLLGQRGHLG